MPVAVGSSKYVYNAIMGSTPKKNKDRAKAAAIIERIEKILFPNNHEEVGNKKNELKKIFDDFEREYDKLKKEILELYSVSNEGKIKEYISDNEIEDYRRNQARTSLDIIENKLRDMKNKSEKVISSYKIGLKTINEVFNEIKKLEKLGWKVNLTYKEGWEGHKATPIPPAGEEFYQPKITKFEGKKKYEEMNKIVMEFANLSSKIITSDIEDDISKKTYGISFLIEASKRVTKGGLNIYSFVIDDTDDTSKRGLNIYGSPFLDIKIDLNNERVDVELSNTVFFK